MKKREIFGKEYILFSQIKTEQKIVRKYRLETFRKFLREGKIDKISPILLIPIENSNYFGYRIIDGNHRCRAAFDEGQPGTWAFIGKPYSEEKAHIKSGHNISELNIVDEVIDDDIKYCNWKDSF